MRGMTLTLRCDTSMKTRSVSRVIAGFPDNCRILRRRTGKVRRLCGAEFHLQTASIQRTAPLTLPAGADRGVDNVLSLSHFDKEGLLPEDVDTFLSTGEPDAERIRQARSGSDPRCTLLHSSPGFSGRANEAAAATLASDFPRDTRP